MGRTSPPGQVALRTESLGAWLCQMAGEEESITAFAFAFV